MIRFQQIRSATVKLYYPGVTFLIDPWLKDAAEGKEKEDALQYRRFIEKPVVPLPCPPEQILSDVDAVLVTHMHGDHFSEDYLPKDRLYVFQNETDMQEAEKAGFRNTMYFEKPEILINGVSIIKTEAVHGDNEILAEKAGPACGYVFLKENEKTVYAAGDTVFCPQVTQIISTYHPDIIIVNSCDARTRSGRLIMNSQDVIDTCRAAGNGIVIASHMGAVSHAHLTREQLRSDLEEAGLSQQVYIPEDGEFIDL